MGFESVDSHTSMSEGIEKSEETENRIDNHFDRMNHVLEALEDRVDHMIHRIHPVLRPEEDDRKGDGPVPTKPHQSALADAIDGFTDRLDSLHYRVITAERRIEF